MRAPVTYRVTGDLYASPKRFPLFKEALRKYRASYDDIALFDSYSHSVRNLEVGKKQLELMGRVCEELRREKLADKAGFNILCTIGHHSENLPLYPQGFTQLTGMNGVSEPGTCCPNDPEYLQKHLRPFYEAAAKAGPDFIWLDDDIRFCGHGDASLICYCPHCMAYFNEKYHLNLTREELLELVNSGTEAEKLEWRRKALANTGDTYVRLFRNVESYVHGINPEIQLGAMDSAMRPGDTADAQVLADALQGNTKLVPRWRPGGGAYTDRQLIPEMVLYKAVFMGCESAMLPDNMMQIEAEIESFNCQRLRKSCRITRFEAALYCAAGTTGTAWNILDACDDFKYNLPIMQAAAEVRPFLDKISGLNRRIRPSGIYNGWKPGHSVLNNLDSGSWIQMNDWSSNPFRKELFVGGLPPAYRPQDAQMTILTGNIAKLHSDDELKALFAKGVYCDILTLKILEQRGLSDLAGFRPGREFTANAIEYLNDHPLNGGSAGLSRDCRMSFARFFGSDGPVCELVPMFPECESMAYLEDYQHNRLSDCSLGLYTNKLGGRVAVAGYYPLQDMLFAGKLTQIKNLFRYLSKDTLTGYVESYHSIAFWVRQNADGKVFAHLAASVFDPSENVSVMLKTSAETAVLTTMDGKVSEIQGTDAGNGYTRFVIPVLEPWSVNLLECK